MIDVPRVNWYTEISDFKETIRSFVCEAGGDAAVAYANGSGQYIKATVLKRSAKAVVASKTTDARDGAVPGSGADESIGGCRFDTQCKGDRICVDGRCAAPAAATTPGAASAPGAAAPPGATTKK